MMLYLPEPGTVLGKQGAIRCWASFPSLRWLLRSFVFSLQRLSSTLFCGRRPILYDARHPLVEREWLWLACVREREDVGILICRKRGDKATKAPIDCGRSLAELSIICYSISSQEHHKTVISNRLRLAGCIPYYNFIFRCSDDLTWNSGLPSRALPL